MFLGCSSFNQPLPNWNVTPQMNVQLMFRGCTLFNQDLRHWRVSALQQTTWNMFEDTSMTPNHYPINFLPIPIVFSNLGNLNEAIEDYLSDRPSRRHPPIAMWDVSGITNMNLLFRNKVQSDATNRKLQGIEHWNVSNVTHMLMMFSGCTSFNQPLDGWGTRVGRVTVMNGMFVECSSFNQPFLTWRITPQTNVAQMFRDCTLFNQDLSHWEVNTTELQGMLSGTAMTPDHYPQAVVVEPPPPPPPHQGVAFHVHNFIQGLPKERIEELITKNPTTDAEWGPDMTFNPSTITITATYPERLRDLLKNMVEIMYQDASVIVTVRTGIELEIEKQTMLGYINFIFDRLQASNQVYFSDLIGYAPQFVLYSGNNNIIFGGDEQMGKAYISNYVVDFVSQVLNSYGTSEFTLPDLTVAMANMSCVKGVYERLLTAIGTGFPGEAALPRMNEANKRKYTELVFILTGFRLGSGPKYITRDQVSHQLANYNIWINETMAQANALSGQELTNYLLTDSNGIRLSELAQLPDNAVRKAHVATIIIEQIKEVSPDFELDSNDADTFVELIIDWSYVFIDRDEDGNEVDWTKYNPHVSNEGSSNEILLKRRQLGGKYNNHDAVYARAQALVIRFINLRKDDCVQDTSVATGGGKRRQKKSRRANRNCRYSYRKSRRIQRKKTKKTLPRKHRSTRKGRKNARQSKKRHG